MAPFWKPKCFQNRIKNPSDFGTVLASKMHPKLNQKEVKVNRGRSFVWAPKRFENSCSHARFRRLPGLPVPPFFTILGPFWLPQAIFFDHFGCLRRSRNIKMFRNRENGKNSTPSRRELKIKSRSFENDSKMC